ncbi:MAG: hypothetical protein ABIJ00_06820 [Candidatus Eisenbacteria bacterium]
MKKTILWFGLVVAVLACAGCTQNHGLPDDEDLELFIELSSQCAYIDRTYSHQEDLREAELAALPFPPNWSDFVDTLLLRYGTDAGFWYDVYSEISARSRGSSTSEESRDVK